MPAKRYLVELSPDERQELNRLVSCGKRSARALTRARILLKADQAEGGPAWDDGRIAEALGCGLRTVERVRQRLVEEGLPAALPAAIIPANCSRSSAASVTTYFFMADSSRGARRRAARKAVGNSKMSAH